MGCKAGGGFKFGRESSIVTSVFGCYFVPTGTSREP